jgi:hypothetical protein
MRSDTTWLFTDSLSKRVRENMSPSLPLFISEIEKTRQALNRIQGKQLHSQKQRDGVRSLVERYFNRIRPTLVSAEEQNDDIKIIDSDMQELLMLCHKHATLKRYKELITEIRSNLIKVDRRLVSSTVLKSQAQTLDVTDARIIITSSQ